VPALSCPPKPQPCVQDGKIPKLDAILAESESEEEPDMVIEVPANKVKLMVGPGGERIKLIQRKSKCRVQARRRPAHADVSTA